MKDSTFLVLIFYFGIVTFNVGFTQMIIETGFSHWVALFLPSGVFLMIWVSFLLPYVLKAGESRPNRRNNRRLTPKGAKR
jgi:hypothetical protein